MTSFIYSTAVTLDGFIADPEHSLEWLFAVDSTDAGGDDLLETSGALVMGSHTYEWLLGHEEVLDHPEKWFGFYGGRRVFVFSTRDLPIPTDADVRLLRGSVADALPAIREASGESKVWPIGGGDLVGQFADAGALDEIEVNVAPVLLGGGAPLLPRRIESDRLRLVNAARHGQFVTLRYELTRPSTSGTD